MFVSSEEIIPVLIILNIFYEIKPEGKLKTYFPIVFTKRTVQINLEV